MLHSALHSADRFEPGRHSARCVRDEVMNENHHHCHPVRCSGVRWGLTFHGALFRWKDIKSMTTA